MGQNVRKKSMNAIRTKKGASEPYIYLQLPKVFNTLSVPMKKIV